MSVEIVKKAMANFLSNPAPEVLCIKGKWGTGKTYAWESAVKAASSDKSNPLPFRNYAYVSLFGVKDSTDIIQAVFANMRDLYEQKKLPTLSDKFGDITKKIRKTPVFAAEHANVPYISGLGGVARALLSNFVRDTLVCFDDFERKSKTMTVNEIMGTIAQLRDERKCKIVLILNEDSLDQAEHAEFVRYSEKVINTSFKFEPTGAEAAEIAFADTDSLSKILRDACSELLISNIRVLQKINSFARNLNKLLEGQLSP